MEKGNIVNSRRAVALEQSLEVRLGATNKAQVSRYFSPITALGTWLKFSGILKKVILRLGLPLCRRLLSPLPVVACSGGDVDNNNDDDDYSYNDISAFIYVN
jgi:hypothetical protein